MATGPLHLWNHWSIQTLVLLSLSLQLFLFAFAGKRRHGANPVLRFLLWMVYLMADSTAIFALGHLSLSGTTREHRLVYFWAPFLLLHLGGPDNITAYALQDNQLWPRHLQILIVQVLGAAYVLYKEIAANGLLVLLATALMFGVGVVKYVERTWALRCSNLSSIRCSIKKERPTRHDHFHRQDEVEGDMDESILRRAHSLFHICKRAIVDSSVDVDSDYHDTRKRLGPIPIIWPLIEMELSLMYDILYTKAGVTHTWYGYCVRIISPLATAASLLLFQFSRKDGDSSVDILITYILFGGALFMETTSLLNALGSTWTFAFLCTTRWNWLRYEALCTARWDRLRRAVASLHQLIKATMGGDSSYKSRRWSGTVGQYNMLHFCTRPDSPWTSPLFGRLAKMVGLREWWDKKHYSGSVEITELVKKHIVDHMKRLLYGGRWNTLGLLRKKWGQEALELEQYQSLKNDGSYKAFMDSLGVELQEGIIIWHIGTDVFLAKSKQAKEEGASANVEVIKMLSNYMMFLLVEHPDMLPGLAQNRLYQRTCENLINLQSTPGHRSMNLGEMLHSLFRLHDNPSTSRATERENLGSILYDRESSFKIDAPRLSYVTGLARLLIAKEEAGTNAVLLVLDVWTDMLVYAGNKGSRESHAKKLNRGAELTTILWLMAEHLSHAYYEQV
ncbi:unnamed protein product [Urochloa decumbens]|uniref:DUF4220 domain-containing protein n=1 Tax=Urochloa decumbens TaxID=240449 RepID=A0ABC9FP71_9POAL